MSIPNLQTRLERIEQALTRVAEGDFDQTIALGQEDDALGSLEMGLNFMLMDLKAMDQANRDKEQMLLEQKAELEEKLETIAKQADAIRELSTPVMEIWEGILVLPVVGLVDTRRSLDIMNNLLAAVVSHEARCVIIDITGVEVVDTRTADYLLKISRAANLLGTRCVLTGLSPAVAQTLVELGVDLSELRTLRNLKDGLMDGLRYLEERRAVALTSGG